MCILRWLAVSAAVVMGGAFLMNHFGGERYVRWPAERDTVSTFERAREQGAKVGERAARTATNVGESASRTATKVGERAARTATRVEQTLTEAALSAKIKAKMALDDNVKARAIDVTTQGTTVTLSGRVASKAERARAVTLARETAGVTKVVDDLRTP